MNRAERRRAGANGRAATRGVAVLDWAETFHEATEALRGNDIPRAERGFRTYLAAVPNDADAWHRLSLIEATRAEFAKALGHVDRALAIDPENAGYLSDRGLFLTMLARPEDAVDSYERALVAAPQHPTADGKLAELYRQQKRWNDAIPHFRRAILNQPDDHELHAGLGVCLNETGRIRAAVVSLEKAVALAPEDPMLHVLLGNSLRLLSRMDDAAACYQRAAELQPDSAMSYSNLGVVWAEMGETTAADVQYQRAIAMSDNPATHFNRSILLLHRGELAEGWDEWEFGLESGQRIPNRKIDVPRWDGSDVDDQTVMIWREQGVGDEILFAECVPDVVARAKHVIVECDERLVPLFGRSFPGATVRAQTIDGSGAETIAPDFDLHCPAGSVMRLLRPTVESFGREVGYLRADDERTAEFRAWLRTLGPGLKVGVSWRSVLQSAQRSKYYTVLDDWGPIFAVPGVQFVNVQYDECEQELMDAEDEFGMVIHRPDLDLFRDLDGCAALSTALDLVIAPNTCVSHLAGAVGTRTWQPTIAFCEAFLGTPHYPWLPSLRCYQREWDESWTKVIDAMARDLRLLVGTGG